MQLQAWMGKSAAAARQMLRGPAVQTRVMDDDTTIEEVYRCDADDAQKEEEEEEEVVYLYSVNGIVTATKTESAKVYFARRRCEEEARQLLQRDCRDGYFRVGSLWISNMCLESYPCQHHVVDLGTEEAALRLDLDLAKTRATLCGGDHIHDILRDRGHLDLAAARHFLYCKSLLVTIEDDDMDNDT